MCLEFSEVHGDIALTHSTNIDVLRILIDSWDDSSKLNLPQLLSDILNRGWGCIYQSPNFFLRGSFVSGIDLKLPKWSNQLLDWNVRHAHRYFDRSWGSSSSLFLMYFYPLWGLQHILLIFCQAIIINAPCRVKDFLRLSNLQHWELQVESLKLEHPYLLMNTQVMQSLPIAWKVV